MIFCENGSSDAADFDNLVVLVSQLRGCGVPAVIAADSAPRDLRPSHQFDATPFLTRAPYCSTDSILLLDAHKAGPERATSLRELTQGVDAKCIAFGEFATRQSEITIAGRLAYALNINPQLHQTDASALFVDSTKPVFGSSLNKADRTNPRVGLFAPDLSNPEARAQLQMLRLGKGFDFEIITTGAAKKNWIDQDGYQTAVWHLGELLPRALAARYDIAVMFAKPAGWLRMQMLVANLCAQGTPLIDATASRDWVGKSRDIIAGPTRISDLGVWLEGSILPDLPKLQEAAQSSDLTKAFGLPPVLRDLQHALPQHKSRKRRSRNIVFMPTNGVGLGHAKRCSLIADQIRAEAKPFFAAFPSCTGMLTASGFDTVPLVSRATHCPPHTNDLVNFGRLSGLAEDAAALVFDGGYVFDSIMRAAADHARPSIWIRRGLWQAGQNNQVALDRQKTFNRIVVPTEAFDELNGDREARETIRYVGPIVQEMQSSKKARKELRDKLTSSLGLNGEKLVITMLGGGVAADRRAQINAICTHMEKQPDAMHIVVVWPTATTDPGWFQYKNTRVVQSVHASVLLPLADLFISAIGYNSFHEAIYGQIPTIFIPQMASFMDDQRARGQAAADREIAVLIEPWEILSLTKAIDDCLAERGAVLRKNLSGLNLPQSGAAAAARHILECIA